MKDELLNHPVQQQSNVILGDAPILPSTSFTFFIMDGSANSFECVSKAERISLQIFVDVSLNQNIATRAF
jgi:hypothetical protein